MTDKGRERFPCRLCGERTILLAHNAICGPCHGAVYNALPTLPDEDVGATREQWMRWARQLLERASRLQKAVRITRRYGGTTEEG